MSAPLLMVSAVAVAVIALTVCARVLWRPLALVLLDLCGEPHRARFWTQMVATCMVAVAVAGSLMGVLVAPSAPPALVVAAVIRWNLLGIASGLVAVAAGVAVFTRRGAAKH